MALIVILFFLLVLNELINAKVIILVTPTVTDKILFSGEIIITLANTWDSFDHSMIFGKCSIRNFETL